MDIVNKLKKEGIRYLPFGYTRNGVEEERGADVIIRAIRSKTPFLAGKVGWTEANCLLGCTNRILRFYNANKIVLKIVSNPRKKIAERSGFYPNDKKNVKRFCDYYLDCLENVDILASWIKQEQYLKEYTKNAIKISLSSLEPFSSTERPWTSALGGMRVLVIHPFASSIVKQYEKRSLLHADDTRLPAFELITLRSLMSRANNKVAHRTWWDALGYMKNEVDKKKYDIAIIGCGSYSIPLGAHIKSVGKMAIHLGGTTQLLFGIKGSRWDNYAEKLYNEHWIRPVDRDTPHNIHTKDSYW